MKLPKVFKSDTPVLPNVKIVETWGHYDGPLFGVCEINGLKFFFLDIIFDIWRYYEDDTSERLWAIYAVYDIDIEGIRGLIKRSDTRSNWEETLLDLAECIGIFWEYESRIS